MKRAVAGALLCALLLWGGATVINGDRTMLGFFDLSSGSFRPPEVTAANLPAASGVTGRVYMVTDAAVPGACTTGGGSTRVGCRSTGAAYECIWNCSAGSSPLTTKGDLYGYSTGAGRIPVGSDGQVLTAASSQPFGLQWATPSGGSGTPVNGGVGGGPWWPFGQPSLNSTGGNAPVVTATRASRWLVTALAPVEFRYVNVQIDTALGTGCTGGTCGFIICVRDGSMTHILAQTSVLTSGTVTGPQHLSLSSGNDVTDGVADLPAGSYYITFESDSSATRLNAFDDKTSNSLINGGSTSYYGNCTSATSTGDGASLTPTVNLSALGWGSVNVPAPDIVFTN